MPASRREQILVEIQRVFAEATPADSGGGTTWGRVLDSDYRGREFRGQNVMSVMEGTETYLDKLSTNARDRRLEVDLMTRVYVPRGVALRTGANDVLADIEEICAANELWGGLAMATFFLSNTVEREDTGDRTIDLSLFITVQYRAFRSDPRQS